MKILKNKDKELRMFKVIIPSPTNHNLSKHVGEVFESLVKECSYKGDSDGCCWRCPGYVIPPWMNGIVTCFGLKALNRNYYLYIQEIIGGNDGT